MLYRRWLLVIMLALAGILTAMAYDHANIGNEATAAVVRTNSALLALSCVEHDGDEEFCIMDGGNLNLNFGQVAPPAPFLADAEFYADYVGNHWKLFAKVIEDGKEKIYEFSEFHKAVAHDSDKKVKVVNVTPVYGALNCWLIDWAQSHNDNPTWKTGTEKFCYEGSGIQPGGSYSFFDLIKITNNSSETVRVGIDLSDSLVEVDSPLIIKVTSEPEGAGTDFFPGGEQHKLNPGESVRASFELTLGEDWNGQSGSIEGSITVTSTVE